MTQACLNSLCLKDASSNGRGIVSMQGWSNVSESLSEQLMVTRKKLELIQLLEHALKENMHSHFVYFNLLMKHLEVAMSTSPDGRD